MAGTWAARYLTETSVLSADSQPALRELIRQDHAERRWVDLAAVRAELHSRAEVGAGELALRRLRDDGVI